MGSMKVIVGVVACLAVCHGASASADTFQVEFDVQLKRGTTGKFVVEVYPEW